MADLVVEKASDETKSRSVEEIAVKWAVPSSVESTTYFETTVT